MRTFDPREWWNPSWFKSPGRRRPEDLNRETLQRWALAVAFCFCFAALGPPSLFASAFAGLLVVAAIASTALACLQGHSPLARHLTGWDEAAWSLVLSLALGAWSAMAS